FQVKGFGTVITGTLLEGKISVGDELEIYPNNIITKVRNIQVHETDVKTAFTGQRTAINLNNIKVEEVCRGTILATPGTLIKTYMIDVEIKIINNSDFNLKLWDRVRVYIGTREVMARVVPLGTEIIKAGKNEFAQLRLEEEISVKNYDKFIIRTYSPMVTIGGGIILDAVPKKHNRFNEETLNKLKIQLQGDSKDLIESYLLTDCRNMIKIDEILKNFNEIKENILLNLKRLVEEKSVYETSSGYLHMKKYEDFKYKILKIVNEYHIKNKLRKGIVKAELLSKFKNNQKEIIAILDLMISNKNLEIDNNFISLFDFKIKYDVNQIKHKNRMEKSLLESEFLPIGIKELTQGSKEAIEVLESLIGSTIVRLDGDIVIHEKVFKDAKSKLLNHFKNNKKILLSEFRDMIGSSRKYSLALLEYMDRLGITKRVDDYRVLGNNT
ncbi:MAG: SelB C-terminal domain-containing protein, partial [Leptotrichiaceae bacterium]|nr:SelB C-terminal domain-containing protein [Leptotrichiaceae bacterium]